MLKKLIVAAVRFSAGHPWPVLLAALVMSAASAYYAGDRFAINTDITTLISPKLEWRQREVRYLEKFPGQATTILAVIDAPAPEAAEEAAQQLTERLNKESKVIQSAQELMGGPFFRRNGLLFLPQEDLREALSQMTRSSSFLDPLAADPSLRGIMDAFALPLRGIQLRRVQPDSLAPQFNGLAAPIEDALAGRPAHFSWRQMLSGQPPAPRELRQFVEIVPILNYNSLEPGEDATNMIHQTADSLHLKDKGVTVRLTGTIPIADDEFATLKEGAAINGLMTVFAVLVILWLALHSARIIFAVFVSLFAGLLVTAAAGLALAGSFNPISIAFFVLFVGIGVDFGLQFSVSYRAERFERGDLFESLVATAENTGARLALAAAATAAGFLAFTPTAYQGLSELGEIAGLGMIVAFLMSITVLPAMLRLLNPPAEPDPLGYAFLAPVDRFLERHRMAVLVGTLCAVLAAAPLLYWLSFNFNPMDLRSPNVESVSTYLDLKKDPEMSGQTIEILEPSLAEANAMAKKLSALPEVSKAITLSFFVPEDQDAKLTLIADAATTLDGPLNPKEMKPAPTDAEIIDALDTTAGGLRAVAAKAPESAGGKAADRLSKALTALAKAAPELRSKVQDALTTPLKITLRDIRESLHPEKIVLSSLPHGLASSWLAADGSARVSVLPRGDINDNLVLENFAQVITKIAPEATGQAVGLVEAGKTIVSAFEEAAIWALISIAILLYVALRRITDVVLTLFPLILAGIVTLESTVIVGMQLNYANIIALPLLLGVGVAFKIYYIVAWRQGKSGLLASPLTRAVFFSGMTTAVAFGSLMLSNHPGTASMGQLLALSLVSTMAAAVLFQPLLMGPPRTKETTGETAPAAKQPELTPGE
jgi:uncharacterized protein